MTGGGDSRREKEKDATRQFFLVYHPLVVENVDLALQSIGGIKTVAKAIDDSRILNLRVQPENEFHCGLLNERQETATNLKQIVFKFQRNKRTGKIRSQFLGVVKNTFHYNQPCDFQLLPLAGVKDGAIYDDKKVNCRDIINDLLPTTVKGALTFWNWPPLDEASFADNYYPPFVYSRFLKVNHRLFSPEDILLEATASGAETGGDTSFFSKSVRPERKSYVTVVQAKDVFPSEPPAGLAEELTSRCPQEEIHRKLKELFERRPIWTKSGILKETGIEQSIIKNIIPMYAFYVMSGAFGRCWCRYGYDAKSIRDSKQYQSISITLRFNEMVKEKYRVRTVASTDTVGLSSATMISALNLSTDASYKFTPGSVPPSRQMWFCMCDIDMELARNIISTDYSTRISGFDDTFGWVPQADLEALREVVKNDCMTTIESLRGNLPKDFVNEMDYKESDLGLDDLF